MIGLEGSTRMDKNGQVSLHREALGGFKGTNQNFVVPTNIVHIVVGSGRGTLDRTNQKIIGKSVDPWSECILDPPWG